MFHKLSIYEVFGTADLSFGMAGCSCCFLEDWVHTNEFSKIKYFPLHCLLEKLCNYNVLYFKISFYNFESILAVIFKRTLGRFNYCYCYHSHIPEGQLSPET